MAKFEVGDRVRISIPDQQDPDNYVHEEAGMVIAVFQDSLSGLTGDEAHDFIYTVSFYDPSLGCMDFRYDDLKPL